jgi:hypothetical protein
MAALPPLPFPRPVLPSDVHSFHTRRPPASTCTQGANVSEISPVEGAQLVSRLAKGPSCLLPNCATKLTRLWAGPCSSAYVLPAELAGVTNSILAQHRPGLRYISDETTTRHVASSRSAQNFRQVPAVELIVYGPLP